MFRCLKAQKRTGDNFGSMTIFRVVSQEISLDRGIPGIFPDVAMNDRVEANG
jgi:hypothetical protein